MAAFLGSLALAACIIGVSAAGFMLAAGVSLPGPAMNEAWGDFLRQVLATVVGALVAALVSYDLARRSRLSADYADAFKLLMKVSLITNSAHSTMATIDGFLQNANDSGNFKLALWQKVMPIVGLKDPITIQPEELAPFYAGKETNLANDVVELQMQHEVFLAGLTKFFELRRGLLDQLRVDDVDGEIVAGSVAPEKTARFQADARQAEMLITEMIKLGRQHHENALRIGGRVGPAGRRIFGERFPTLVSPKA